MKKVLILAGCPHATVTLYRCVHLQEQFAEIGYSATVQEWDEQSLQPAQVAAAFDLVVLQRVAMSGRLRQLIEQLHGQGKPVIFDTDDLVFEPTMTQWHRGAQRLAAADQQLYADGVQRYQTTLLAADFVFTASPLLAELAQRHGKPAFVHRNAVGRELQSLAEQLSLPLPAGEREAGVVVIGYGSGTPTHDVDFAQTVPALLDILTRYPQVELWLAGPLELPKELAVFGARIRRFPLRDWRGYLELASRFSIALAPLEQGNLFCRAKSEIKWMEAALLGIPTVASPVDPFVHAIEPGQTGLLAGNTAEWIGQLERLITDANLRRTIGQAAQHKVAEQYSLIPRAKELAGIMQQLERHPPLSQPSNSAAQGEPEATKLAPLFANSPQPEPPPAASQAAAVPLVLNWIVNEPFAGSGGHLGIFRMIKHLVEFGHECHIYVVPIEKMHNFTPAQLQQFVDLVFMPTGAHFHRWNGRVDNADATVATYWSTAYQLAELPNPGRAYYFVQDFEPYFYPMGSDYLRAENTYRLGLHCITLGGWLAQLLHTQYGATADPFDFAVDTEIYWPQPVTPASRPRVTFYARPSTPRRAYELGLEALQLLKNRLPSVEILLFGATQLDPHPNFAHVNLGIRNQYELATHYSSCDVGLVLSLTNPSFVPLELMACKCAVVDLRSERVQGLLTHGENALLAEPTPESMANTLLQLLLDQEQRQQLVERAYQQVRSLTWIQSARQIEAIFLRHAPPPAERVFSRRAQGQDAAALLWQIQQLLDHRTASHSQVTELETTLQRVLAEKAQLAAQLRQTEAALQALQRQQQGAVAQLRQLGAQTLAGTPGWQVGHAWLTKVPLAAQPLYQSFRGEKSHLTSLTLYFAASSPTPSGALQLALYEENLEGRLLAEVTIMAAAVQPDQPYWVEFPAQPYSRDREYLLVLRLPSDASDFGYQLWAYFRPQLPGSKLQRGAKALRGQLAVQPGYTPPGLPAPASPNLWANPPQPLPTVWRAAGQRGAQEGTRLARNVITALRTRGLRGLSDEVLNYVRWQLKK